MTKETKTEKQLIKDDNMLSVKQQDNDTKSKALHTPSPCLHWEDRIFEEKDQNDEFWIMMGPFFGSRSVRKELPYIMNQPGQTWFVICENKTVIGFVSGLLRKDYWYLDNIYVIPEYRHQNLLSRLIMRFMTYYAHQDPTKKVRLETQNPIIREYFLKHAFTQYKPGKSWNFLEGAIFGVE